MTTPTTTSLDTGNLQDFGSRLTSASQNADLAQGAKTEMADTLTTAGQNGQAAGNASLAEGNASQQGNAAGGGAAGGDCAGMGGATGGTDTTGTGTTGTGTATATA